MKPLVSIICISYNQEKYIEQALEGFLMQDVNFSYEIIIHDDASTDGTQKVIQKFINKYPAIFRPVLQTKNRYSKSGVLFLKEMYQMARGKYVAVCEGDDFWTESTKLQKQVDFLEKNNDYALVFHPVNVVFEEGEELNSIFPKSTDKTDFKLEDLLKTNFIHTNSVLYRRQDYTAVNPNVMPIDWYMHLFHAQFGKIGFINETMAVYRKHRAGIWWETTHQDRDEIWKKHGIGHLVLYAELLKMYGAKNKNKRIIDGHIKGTVEVLNRIDNSAKTNLMNEFVEKFPELSGTLLLSLSRITYTNYIETEKNNELLRNIETELRAELQKMSSRAIRLEREKEEIVNSKAYRIGNKLARVSRSIRRIK